MSAKTHEMVFQNEITGDTAVVTQHTDGAGLKYSIEPTTSTLILDTDVKKEVANVITTNLETLISISKPVILSPVGGALYLVGIKSSNFTITGNHVGYHERTDWEIALDASFTDIEAFSYNDSVNLRSFSFNPKQHGQTYYVRCKYKSGLFESNWSVTATFTTSTTRIDNPILSLLEAASGTTLQPSFFGSDFLTIDGTDTHVKTLWVLTKDTLNGDIVFSLASTTDLTKLDCPVKLIPGTSYFLKAMYVGETLESTWSNVVTFKTGTKAVTPMLSANLYAYENTVIPVSINNFDADSVYTVESNLGEVNRIDNVIYITIPTVTVDTKLILNVGVKNNILGLLDSDVAVLDIDIVNIGLTTDQFIDSDVAKMHDVYSGKNIPKTNDVSNFELNLIDPNYKSIVSRIYIDNLKCEIKAGDTLYANDGEEFTVKTVNDDGTTESVFDVVSISIGGEHVLLLTKGGYVYAAGSNDYGQLGTGDFVNSSTFVLVATGIVEINAGHVHSGLLRKDKRLCLAGDGTRGQLGNGTLISSPNWIVYSGRVKSFDLGVYHTCYVLDNDIAQLYITGSNNYGQLGLNLATDAVLTTFTLVTVGIDKVACGQYYTACKTLDGFYAYFGGNDYGQLGIGSYANVPSFTKSAVAINAVYCGGFTTYMVNTDSVLLSSGDNKWGQAGINSALLTVNVFTATGINVTEVYPQQYAVIVRAVNGLLMAAGKNGNGELQTGDSVNVSKFKELLNGDYKVVCVKSYYNFLGVKTDNKTYAIGDNGTGQLGNNTTVNIGTLSVVFDKSAYSTYKPKYWIVPVTNLSSTPVRVYSSKRYSRLAEIVQEDDDKDFKQIVNLKTVEIASDIKDDVNISTISKLFIKDSISTAKPGDKFITDKGIIITADTIADDGVITNVSAIKKIAKDTYNGATFILLENGDLYGTGYNTEGQLGLPSTMTAITNWTKLLSNCEDVVAGPYSTFVVLTDGTVYATGFNQNGGLGVGSIGNVYGFTLVIGINNPKKIVPGVYHSAIIGSDDILYTAGSNGNYQLALNATGDKPVFTSTEIPVLDVALTTASTMFIKKSDSKLYGVGANAYGELGTGDTTPYHAVPTTSSQTAVSIKGMPHGLVIKRADGKLYYTGYFISNNTQKTFKEITGLSSVNNFYVGYNYVVATDTDNSLYGFGENFLNHLFFKDNTFSRSGFTKTEYKCVDYVSNHNSALIKTTSGQYYGVGDRVGAEFGAIDASGTESPLTPRRVYFEYPVYGSYKTNKWIVPKETLTEVPNTLYPLSDFYFNDIKSDPISGAIVSDVITIERDNVEFEPTRTIITRFESPKATMAGKFSMNIEKVL